LQAKLLRVLQEREFERVGESQTVKVDVRVIAATHADLAKMVEAGEFREDLFYRLNVVPVRMPALRERRDDIPLLVQHFLSKLARDSKQRKGPSGLSQDAMRQLMAYRWPGNVRQLENIMERMFTLLPGRSQIEVDDLPDDIRAATPSAATAVHAETMSDHGVDLDGYLSNVELMLIRKALDHTQGNKRRAADLLQIKRTTLIEKLKRLERRN
jgi:transcriptional regulator with PAS, ATPase and Fis domain